MSVVESIKPYDRRLQPASDAEILQHSWKRVLEIRNQPEYRNLEIADFVQRVETQCGNLDKLALQTVLESIQASY